MFSYIKDKQKKLFMMTTKVTLEKSTVFLLLFLLVSFISCGDKNQEPVDQNLTEETDTITTNQQQDEDYWDYENTNWEEISDSECRSAVQSPVNIVTEDVIEADLADIEYEYEPFAMRIVDNGHTIQVHGTEDSYITVEGKRYQFRQFHFHYPSEHTIDGKQYPMEMHLVHQEEGTSNLAVLGIFLEEAQNSNEFLQKVLAEIPEEKEQEVTTDVQVDLSDYIPPSQVHYTYIGSLTTPPCTVGVDWIVFSEPIQASREQLDMFSSRYSNNARPPQPLNNRRVLKSME